MTDISVRAENLTKIFGSFTAVNRVTFQVKKGEIFGFLGANGAGKTTTIRMLCGLISPSDGAGTVGGFDIRTESEKIKKNIGYMSQKFSLYQDLTVEENIRFYSGIYNVKKEKKKERMEWVLKMSGLDERKGARTAILSGGWKQRLALGCAVIHEPSILFLDEPTSGVDPIARRSFWDLIYSLAEKGVTIFVTTHYMDEAEYCDRISLMEAGKIIALGTPAELKENYFPYDVYSIESSFPIEALAILKKTDFVADAALFGQSIHIVIKDKSVTESKLNVLLKSRKISFKDLKKITPSLEDVFVWLIEKEKERRQNGS